MRALKSDLGVMNPLRRRSWLAVTSILTVSAFAPPSRPMRCRGDMVHSRQCGHYRTVPLPYEYKMYGLKWWLQNENRLESSPQEEDVAPISTDPAAKKTKTKTTKSKKAVVTKTDDDEPTYWKMQSDEALITEESIKFTVRGKPVPLRRHRTSRGFMYNPSARNQEEFRQVVSQILPSLMMGPYFGEDDFLAINIVFHLRRPKSHFVGEFLIQPCSLTLNPTHMLSDSTKPISSITLKYIR